MHSSTIVLAVGVLAIPLALTSLPPQPARASAAEMQLAQAGPPAETFDGRKLEDAPVPRGLGDGLSPANRAGSTNSPTLGAGPVDSTPFSGAPSSGQPSGSPAERVAPTGGGTNLLPSLGH